MRMSDTITSAGSLAKRASHRLQDVDFVVDEYDTNGHADPLLSSMHCSLDGSDD
jgi:hypothetical protein